MDSPSPAKIQWAEPGGWGGVRGGVNPPLEKGMGGFCGTQDSFRGSTRQRPEASADFCCVSTHHLPSAISFPPPSGPNARFLGKETNGQAPFPGVLEF